MNKFFRYWLPLAAYCALIFFQSHHSAPEDIPSFPGVDKLLHLGGYALLGVLFYRAYFAQWPQASVRSLLRAAVASTVLYGLSDEFHQSFIPTRSPELLDALADAFGGFLGAAAYLAWLSFTTRRSAERAEAPD